MLVPQVAPVGQHGGDGVQALKINFFPPLILLEIKGQHFPTRFLLTSVLFQKVYKYTFYRNYLSGAYRVIWVIIITVLLLVLVPD